MRVCFHVDILVCVSGLCLVMCASCDLDNLLCIIMFVSRSVCVVSRSVCVVSCCHSLLASSENVCVCVFVCVCVCVCA